MEPEFNTADYRPIWADPMGKLLEVDECGCRHYELGNGLCEKHFKAIFLNAAEEPI